MGRATKGAQGAGITDRQELFVREYVAGGCGNAASAAIAAGFAAKGARATASQLLTKPNVQARIAELQAPILAKLEITAERVLNEVARIAFARIDQVLSFGPGGVVPKDSATLSEDVLAAIGKARQTITAEGGTITMDMHDKLGALEKLGKYLKLWNEKAESTTPWEDMFKDMSEAQVIERAETLRAARLRAQAEAEAEGTPS